MSGASMGLRHLLHTTTAEKIVPAVEMRQDQRRIASGQPPVAPRAHGDECAVEVLAHFGEPIFVALGQIPDT